MQKIKDYAIIGDGRSAALIGRNGSIDWLCWPRFDSPSIFAKLLDSKIGGSWKISPVLPVAQINRQYIEDTNVLQTTFFTEAGKVILTDFMSAMTEEEKGEQLFPEHELIRRVKCEEGEVEIEVIYHPHPNYGRDQAVMRDGGKLGLRFEIGQQLITLHSNINFDLCGMGLAKAKLTLKSGNTIDFSLTYSREGPSVVPPLNEEISHKLSRTIAWWKAWAGQAQYQGPYRKNVIRSALTLKLLGFAPSGAFVAAPTTSLPERLGADLNWDYRYCWLRDGSFTVRTLMDLGYPKEAEAFVSWMLHSTRLTLPELKVVYDVYGEKMVYEHDLIHLEGYAHSRPVRIGIATRDQRQLDVYGEVMDGVAYFVKNGGNLDRETKNLVRRIGEYVCRNWQKKDSGIWEERGSIEHYTNSKLMCWVALDKILEMENACGLGLSTKCILEFEKNKFLIRKEIEEKGWNPEIQAYTYTMEGKTLDACMLLMPYYGFHSADFPRMNQTFIKIQAKLDLGRGLLYRYEKSIKQEGAFLICSYWKVDFLARGGGTLEEAHEAFKEVLPYANDLGLFSEEADVGSGEMIGNFPQAFTHLGLINAALILMEKEKDELE